MIDSGVGAGIVSIITESLYDNPIVVFREYVQNSVDSIYKTEQNENREIRIWNNADDLFFLDNGIGIPEDSFKEEMIKIGDSKKRKQKNLGYKGIGRLSGVPYCKELVFVNICDYSKKHIQLYTINGVEFEKIKREEEKKSLSFLELMDNIGKYEEGICDEFPLVNETLYVKFSSLFEQINTGFLVILKSISGVLKNTINDKSFKMNLQWLLPVDFDEELYSSSSSTNQLFKDLTDNTDRGAPVQSCRIFYNDEQLFRPIKENMLRDYVCKSNFNNYAVGFHSFRRDRIQIENNDFSGIRIYIDNMLLCNENELLQALDHYGLLSHTINGQIQSVRGIGAMIYITDKLSISANARRTFIEVTDADSIGFLQLIAEFVNTIYDARYALSDYISFKLKSSDETEKLNKLRKRALDCLYKLAKENIELPSLEEETLNDESVSILDKKKALKRKITREMNGKIKSYLETVNDYNIEKAFEHFLNWLNDNK